VSVESLLEALTVPSVTAIKNTKEQSKDIPTSACSPSSLSSPAEQATLYETLIIVCQDLSITPPEILKALADDDISNWHNGTITNDNLMAFAQSLVQHKDMTNGIVPASYTEHAICHHCGPVWLWFSGEVLGCPWCWHSKSGKQIPRPSSVCCNDCKHFQRIEHPHLGHCSKGYPENISGLWDTDQRYCEWFQSKPLTASKNTNLR